jgi:hypothetical protein
MNKKTIPKPLKIDDIEASMTSRIKFRFLVGVFIMYLLNVKQMMEVVHDEGSEQKEGSDHKRGSDS